MKNYSRLPQWYILTGVNREIRKDFANKDEAFEYLNTVSLGIDNICLFCNGDLKYTKNTFGVYDEQFHTYLKNVLV